MFKMSFLICQLFVLAITAPVFFKKFSSLENGVMTMEQNINSFAEKEFHTVSLKFDWHCLLCHYTVTSTRKLSSSHKSQEYIIKIIYGICKSLHIEDDRVCKGVVQEFKVRKIKFHFSSSCIFYILKLIKYNLFLNFL